LLFRKVIKGIDEKEYELGKANIRIKELEERLEHLRPKKKRRVQTSPNSKFATIRAIKEAQDCGWRASNYTCRTRIRRRIRLYNIM